MTSRRSFLKSMLAAVVMAPAICRLAEEPIRPYIPIDDLTQWFLEQSRAIAADIHHRVTMPSPWLKLIHGGKFPDSLTS